MKTVSINVMNLCVPCENRCRYCLLSYDGKVNGVDYKRSEGYTKRFYEWLKGNRPDLWPLIEFCVSDFRQNQEYHVFNAQDEGLFPLSKFLPVGWDGMRAVCGVNAGPAFRESYFKGISPPSGRRT